MNANILKSLYFGIRSNRLKYFAISALKLLGMRYLVVRMDTNHLCNLRCRMCYFSGGKEKPIPPTSRESFESIASHVLRRARVAYLSCYAEPLCTPWIGELVATAKRHGVPFVSMTSNCMLLNDEKCRALVTNGLDELVVSITGGSAETYEENHQGGRWDTLWENLRLLSDTKTRLQETKPEIKINYILTHKTVREVGGFVDKVKSLHPQFVTLRELAPFRDMDSVYYAENRLTPEDVALIGGVKDTFRGSGIEVVDSLQCTNRDKSRRDRAPERHPCLQPLFQVYIRPDGETRYCLFRDPLGNLNRTDIAELDKSEVARRFRREISSRSTCWCLEKCPNHVDFIESVETTNATPVFSNPEP